MRLALTLLAAAVAVGLSASASAGTKAGVGGTLYEVTFHGKGTVTAVGSAPAKDVGLNSSTMTANWTYTAQPVKMWLANVHGSIKESIVTKASAPLSGDGTANADEDFTWFRRDDPGTPRLGRSQCTAPIKIGASAAYEAEATNGGVYFTVDLAGRFATAENGQVPCETLSGDRTLSPVPSFSAFQFNWNPKEPQQVALPPYNQRMELFDSLERFQIGMPSIDLVLKERSEVTNSENCFNLKLATCNVTFHLTGLELNLRRICSGPLGTESQTACGRQGGGGKQPPPKKPPTTAPVISGLKVIPASFPLGAANVKVSYHDSQPGSTTLIEVIGSIAGHPVPIAVLQHLDTTAAVTVPLPHALVPALAFKPGKFQLQAKVVSPKTGPGNTATTIFVITP